MPAPERLGQTKVIEPFMEAKEKGQKKASLVVWLPQKKKEKTYVVNRGNNGFAKSLQKKG